MKTFFIINPTSGRRKRPDLLYERIKRQCRAAGIEFHIRIWKFPEEMDTIIEEAVAGGYKKIVAAGGDGTVRAVGRCLIGTDVAMGIIPAGSGNGYASHIGYSKRHDDAIQQVIRGRIEVVDTGIFGGIPFLNAAGIGLPAQVAERFAKSKTRGLQSYINLGTQTYFQYEPYSAWLKIDENEPVLIKNILTLDIANGTQWGRGATISPGSTLTDGTFVAVYLQKIAINRIPKLLNQLFNGTLHRNQNVKMESGRTFVIQRKEAGIAHVDGDPVMLGEKIKCEVVEKSLFLVIPPGKFGV